MSTPDAFNADPVAFNAALAAEYRANGGKLGGQFANSRLILLNTIGARSGQPRTTPLGYTTDGDRLVVIASNIGAPAHPAWFHNLVANPEVTVELGRERFQARAHVAAGPERERLLALLATRMPFLADHQRQTARQIPIVALGRIG